MYLMDNSCSTPTSTPGSTGGSMHGSVTGSIDEVPRVKFLCSFLGSILPRPQDGKLRYVGGETRIVSVPRDIGYEELMNRMRELYEGAAVLKYQQPDEDLDALVSVVNDDDVTNMMEEYDKLGSGDGCTRLRIFLFPHPDQDGSMTYVEGDDWETERRYVDALNNLNEGCDAKKCDSPVALVGPDETLLAEQFFNAMSFDGGPQRSGEMLMPPYNLHHLNVSHLDLGHIQPSVHQRFNEIEGSWSPAYYSPRQQGYHDTRMLSDLPSSPSARYRIPFQEIPEKCMDRVPEEYVRQQVNSQASYEQLTQFPDSVGWVPSGTSPGDKAGFPGCVLHAHSIYEGNNVSEQRRIAFNRNQAHLEPSNLVNGIPQAANSCAECHPSRAAYMLNADAKVHHLIPSKEQPIRSAYAETHYREAGFSIPHQLNSHVEEPRVPMSRAGSGRLNDHYVVDGASMNFPAGQGNFVDSHLVHSNYVYHRPCPEFGGEVFHDQVAVSSPHTHIPPPEDHGVRYVNYTPPYGGDNVYHLPHGHVHQQAVWSNIQNPVHGASSYELSALPHQVNGSVNPAIVRSTKDGAAGLSAGVENQNFWAEPSQKIIGFDGIAVAGQSFAHHSKLKTDPYVQESSQYFTAEPVQSSYDVQDFSTSMQPVQLMDLSSPTCESVCGGNQEPGNHRNVPLPKRVEEKVYPEERKEVDHLEGVRSSDVQSKMHTEQKNEDGKSKFASNQSSKANCMNPAVAFDNVGIHGENDPSSLESGKLSVNRLSFLPELIASVKKAALQEVEEAKIMADDSDSTKLNVAEKAAVLDDPEPTNAPGELELDSDNDNHNLSKIEPTKAEEEAISRGLQTIRNDDLEEIRELGSGTYGAVFHGKWKGSDVAIKRIKASCFAGRPSERERLIADFWKEALILSSLHHPNVVSFYGIVRDGPDGSLATVTEFMVNGSLKQFLHKKDRTIDRRKRLIIAMDAAFGMEYLHGKNIVHFDLKCENLLVNMRDPQRPVCKIGDLGLSKVRQHTLVSGGVRGTLPWMAPELLSGKSNMVTEKIDVYSFAIVMWELLTGEEPYADMHCASIIGGIVNNMLRPKFPSWCDPEWKALMEKCWSSDPAERPSFSEISQKLRSMAAAINVK